jgi:HK97 family phage major capsid protein
MKHELKEVMERRNALVAVQTGPNARQFTPEEQMDFNQTGNSLNHLQMKIREHEARNTIHAVWPDGMPGLTAPVDLRTGRRVDGPLSVAQKPMSAEYVSQFMDLLRSGGKLRGSALSEGFDPMFGGFTLPALSGMSAALYETSNSGGGYAVSVPTDGNQLVPLALPDLGVRSVASVIPTATDIKIPSQSTFGTAGIKAESGSSTNTFSESNPTLAQFTLSAFMVGLTHTVSWELLQDVSIFQQFAIGDLLNAIDILEDGFFVTGSGSGQPQGLISNVGTGTGSAVAVESTGAYLLQSTMDVIGTLKASYFGNAGWMLTRATATAIRKAQMQSNLFAQAWTRENGRDFLWGFPVTYSQNMPALPTTTNAGVTPILFGDFKSGFVIGDRHGSGTFVKILDQPLATAGQTILLGYKRVDGRVRRSEAIQGISISHS